MLTDYHVHLRPDEAGSEAERFFTRENAERYRAAASDRGIAELGVSEHVHRFRQALDVWDHPFWREQARDDLDAYCEWVRAETDLRLGIEADFIPGCEDRMASLLDGRSWDYVVGSVHFLRDRAVDMRGDWDVWSDGDPDAVWRRYFETLGEAARSGMFDILAHLDLVKVWGGEGPPPERDPRFYYELAMDGISQSGVAIEVSTAGLRKPVEEIYPAPGFLAMCVEAGRPVSLSSDAHLPEQIGYGYDRALALLSEAGVTEIAVFEGRERRMEQLG